MEEMKEVEEMEEVEEDSDRFDLSFLNLYFKLNYIIFAFIFIYATLVSKSFFYCFNKLEKLKEKFMLVWHHSLFPKSDLSFGGWW